MNSTKRATSRLTRTCPALAKAAAITILLCMAVLISMSWSGCKGPKVIVIPADYHETPVRTGEQFTAPVDGVFMGAAQYQRYRRAVADRIQEEQTK